MTATIPTPPLLVVASIAISVLVGIATVALIITVAAVITAAVFSTIIAPLPLTPPAPSPSDQRGTGRGRRARVHAEDTRQDTRYQEKRRMSPLTLFDLPMCSTISTLRATPDMILSVTLMTHETDIQKRAPSTMTRLTCPLCARSTAEVAYTTGSTIPIPTTLRFVT